MRRPVGKIEEEGRILKAFDERAGHSAARVEMIHPRIFLAKRDIVAFKVDVGGAGTVAVLKEDFVEPVVDDLVPRPEMPLTGHARSVASLFQSFRDGQGFVKTDRLPAHIKSLNPYHHQLFTI